MNDYVEYKFNENDYCKIKIPESCITFNNEKAWVMKIIPEGIKFNREQYPNANPDDFAEAVINILEKCYDVKFAKKED